MEPQPDWFIQGKGPHGRSVWYVRLQITGLLPRRYGPFPTKAHVMMFLEDALSLLLKWHSEVYDLTQKRVARRGYVGPGEACTIEVSGKAAEPH